MLKETCENCGVPFERDAGSYITSMVLNYFMTVICTTAIALVLILRYGFFPGVTPLIAVIACAFILILHRPSKLIYLWLMWVFGFIYHDRKHPDKRLSGRSQAAG